MTSELDWSRFPKQVLVWLITDLQLPVASSPSRQDKATLVDALKRYARQCAGERAAFPGVMLAKAEDLLGELQRRKRGDSRIAPGA